MTDADKVVWFVVRLLGIAFGSFDMYFYRSWFASFMFFLFPSFINLKEREIIEFELVFCLTSLTKVVIPQIPRMRVILHGEKNLIYVSEKVSLLPEIVP